MKKQLAKLDSYKQKSEPKIVTITIDYSQNLDLPHLGDEQPGDCYYYSPINLYCFGIVDSTQEHLHAYIYTEGEGKKGSNNVSSLIMHYLTSNVVEPGVINKELNVIMDNCGGQNKNKTVIRLGAYLQELGWFQDVNLIFLVKGHTKNVADRHFNLMKQDWRKRDVYCFDDCMLHLNNNSNVTVLHAKGLFYAYHDFLSSFFKDPFPGHIHNYHYFGFRK